MSGLSPHEPFLVTFFTDHAAGRKYETMVELEDLARRVRMMNGSSKATLPWLKFARFGDKKTAKGSLRHDQNMISISGIEADYDGEIMSFDRAMGFVRAAGLLCLVYTSPSHSEDGPRWRVLCPLSREYTPDERDRFLGRLNGLFGGMFAPESWTLSQSYYYGSVNHNPSHRAEVARGEPIDLLDALDIGAIGRPVKSKTNGATHHGPATPPGMVTDKRIRALFESQLAHISAAADGAKYSTMRDIAFAIGGRLHLSNWSDVDVVEACMIELEKCSSPVKDWNHARKNAAEAVAAGRLRPMPLENRPNPNAKNNGAHPPPYPHEDVWARDIPPIEVPETPPQDEEDEEDGPPVPPGGEPPTPEDDGRAGRPGEEDVSEQYAMRLFVADNQDKLRYNHSAGTWLTWADHFWRLDERQLALSKIMDLSRGLSATINGRGALARRRVVMRVTFSSNVERGARAMRPIATAQTDWDANHLLLGTPGGVVDLTTAEMREGGREDMISRVTAFTPSEQPDCPTWIAFLTYAMNDDLQLVQFLQRYFGYCLTGLTNEETFLFMFGPGGAGKGTMVETVARIMGDYAGTAPMEVFAATNVRTNAEYYRADLAGKRMIVANEPERGAFWAESFIKETTGGDTISARHPAGRPFRFKPTHKLAMQGNHMPSLRGRSTGMERRLLILPVKRKPKTPDVDLKPKLLAEGPGILRWIIEGCLAWRKIGLSPPDSVRNAGAAYFTAQNNFAAWVEEMCVLDPDARETPSSLLLSFNAWAKRNGEPEMDGKAFAEAIDQSDLPLKRGKSMSQRWVKGISVRAQTSTTTFADDPSDGPARGRWDDD